MDGSTMASIVAEYENQAIPWYSGYGHKRHWRQCDCEREGFPYCSQQGDGTEDYGLSRMHQWQRANSCVRMQGFTLIMMRQEGMEMKTLREAKVGDTVRVVKLHGEGAVKRRIMDMGLTKGVEVQIRKVAPLGDPIEVTVRGYELSIRKADAEMIEV